MREQRTGLGSADEETVVLDGDARDTDDGDTALEGGIGAVRYLLWWATIWG